MSTRSIVLLGGGGHCRSVIDVLCMDPTWAIEGILERAGGGHEAVEGVPVIGGDDRIGELASAGTLFLVTLGAVAASPVRARLFERMHQAGGQGATVVSPLARVAQSAVLGEGTWVGHFALVNSGTRCGRNVVINSSAVVEHDCIIGDHVHVSVRAVLNGGCTVGEGSFVGSGAIVKQGVRIGRHCTIGAGAVVIHDVPDGTTVVGVPAKPIDG
jgi:sugar O-acyltransferase (sialic acid O-acetyltransferase NeuD family)